LAVLRRRLVALPKVGGNLEAGGPAEVRCPGGGKMTPDYLICLECESPVYTFEWQDDHVTEAVCTVCGNEDLSQFATESDYEELSLDRRFIHSDE